MMQFDLTRLVPRFILEDKEGYAMAKAIETGLKDFLAIAQRVLDTWGNVDEMPVWRLDELAWEYNIPYDYNAEADIKREWIRNVQALSRLYGTPEGIAQYMGGYFEEATVEEAWQYDGDPFHFRVRFPGSWTPEKVAWATKAIQAVKNVRSVLDRYTFVGKWQHNLYVGCAMYTHEATNYSVPLVIIEDDWYIDENSDMLLDEKGILLIVE